MSFTPINQEAVQKTCQIGVALLSDDEVRVPTSQMEGALSLKSMLQAVLGGQLFICNKVEAKPEAPAPEKEAAPKSKVKPRAKSKPAK